MLSKRATLFYCRWQNTYFALPSLGRWNKGILKSQWEEQFRTLCNCNKPSLKIQFSSLANHCVIMSEWCLCSWASCCTRWAQGLTCPDINTICMISHSCIPCLTHSCNVSGSRILSISIQFYFLFLPLYFWNDSHFLKGISSLLKLEFS